MGVYNTDHVDKDDVWIVDFPQHLLNVSFRTPSSVHEYDAHQYCHLWGGQIYLMLTTHRRRRRDCRVESCRAVCIDLILFATSSRRIGSRNWKLNTLRICPVQLAAELETWSRLHDATQLDSTCKVFIFFYQISRRDSTVELSRVGVFAV